MNTRIINPPHGTYNEWLFDAMTIIGMVSEKVMSVHTFGVTEDNDEAAKLSELAPEIERLAKSFVELVKPKKPKTDVQAELAKLRAAFGMPDHIKPAPQKGIEREALVDELNKIAAMIGEYEPKFSPLASRLFSLSCRIHREGVYTDDSVPF